MVTDMAIDKDLEKEIIKDHFNYIAELYKYKKFK